MKELSIPVNERKNISVDNDSQMVTDKVFACGDAVSGASLVVRAMASGRNAAEAIDRYLTSK